MNHTRTNHAGAKIICSSINYSNIYNNNQKNIMKLSRNILMSTVILALFVNIISRCSKEETATPPAFHIQQSEKLFIPATISLPAKSKRVVTYYATGVQKYRAQVKPNTTPVAYEWVFVAPQADLFDITNRSIGTHSAGPSWRITGSIDSIYGQHFTPARTAPSPDPSSIDWLLLMPKLGTIPTGIFADVAFIQRIATTGGRAPSTAPVSESDRVEVPYTAV